MKRAILLLFVFAIAITSKLFGQQPGDLDSSFNGSGKVMTDIGTSGDASYASAIQPDGKIIVAGSSISWSQRTGFSLVRLNSDGTLDTSFGKGGIVSTLIGNSNGTIYDEIHSIALQPDGKIVAAGLTFYGYPNGGRVFAATRYNPNGSLDTSFDSDGILILPSVSEIHSIAIQPDGKIVAATGSPFGSGFGAARLLPNGSLDNTFGAGGLQNTIIGTSANVDYPNALALQPDGKIVIAGYYYDGTKRDFALVRYRGDGTLDSTFDGDGILTTSLGTVEDEANAVAVQSDGKIIAGGTTINTTYREFALVRYYPDGRIDSTFDTDGIVFTDIGPFDDKISALNLQADGKIVASGYSNDFANLFALARYHPDGRLDSSFSTDGKKNIQFGPLHAIGYSTVIGAKGQIITSGVYYSYATSPSTFDYAIARCDSSGNLDSTFSSDGLLTLNLELGGDKIKAMALRPDGKIITAGISSSANGGAQLTLNRYLAGGSLDTTFGSKGIAIHFNADFLTSMALQADGKILIGYNDAFIMYRFKSDGSPDSSFGTNGWVSVYDFFISNVVAGINAIAVQPDGKIIAAGFAEIQNSYDAYYALARFKPNGTLDSTFGTNGKVLTNITVNDDKINAIALQADGKIVVAGTVNVNEKFGLARYNTNGSLDNTFGSGGKVSTLLNIWGSAANAVTIQPDGKIIAAGYMYDSLYEAFALTRYLSNGTLDNSFAAGGKLIFDFGANWSGANSVALQADGKIVTSGFSGSWDFIHLPVSDFALARFKTDGTPDSTFGINGKVLTDFSSGYDEGKTMAIQTDGKIIVAGFADRGFDYDYAIARYLSGLNIGVLNFSTPKNSALIYPNPVNHNAVLKYSLNTEETISIHLLDMQGKTIKTFIENCRQGSGEHQQDIILPEGISDGTYIISITSSKGAVGIQIVKKADQ